MLSKLVPSLATGLPKPYSTEVVRAWLYVVMRVRLSVNSFLNLYNAPNAWRYFNETHQNYSLPGP